MKKVLILGLPGAGKTTLASKLAPLIKAKWLNADKIRRESNDWDFSEEGRLRQAKRMAQKANDFKNDGFNVVADFVCPTPAARELFNPDFIVWVDTIEKGRFEDTNRLFIKPKNYDVRVTEKNAEVWSKKIANLIKTD